jgi:hypothetical protein
VLKRLNGCKQDFKDNASNQSKEPKATSSASGYKD